MAYTAYEDVGPIPILDSYLILQDRSHLASLKPSQVQQWTRAKIDELGVVDMNRIRSLSSVCNAAAPINRTLSHDVLMEIFSHLEPSFERPGQLNVLHVCRLWRHLLLYSTAFWVQVVGGFRDPNRIRPDGVALFHTVLQRTRNSPLTVTLDYVNLVVAKTLVRHGSHIVSLTITVSPEELGFVNAWFEQEGMPLLEHLNISHCRSGAETSPPKLLLNRTLFPRLRFLRHPIKTLDVTSIDAQLQDLSLAGCDCGVCVLLYRGSQEEVLSLLTGMLERCTSLQTLKLDRITDSNLQTKDDRTISLPALRRLCILHRTRISMFLTSLAIPNYCIVELSNGYPVRGGPVRDLFPHDILAFHQLAAAQRVRARRRVVELSQRQIFWQVFEAYSTDGEKRFSVHFMAFEKHVPREYRLLLHSMPRLRFLDFQEDARYMATVLGRVTSGRCVCPQLEELDVRWLFQYDSRFEGLERDDEEFASLSPDDNSTSQASHCTPGPNVLSIFCDYIRRMLLNRAAAGSPLKKLHVRMDRQVVSGEVYVGEESWEESVLRERMLARLGPNFEGDLIVSVDEEMSFRDTKTGLVHREVEELRKG
ncbi:hypothetical protein L226DRAFT_569890 [Lentinus tigrinus ALCF2SS1-7]|uniref:F-box domain-containing protein n=1 Tax=Lentinus tigrinus ALCF2SS1-6 TaxID=1328759 RepID=A0A5C2SKS4_9APHY|nr:hypothetical protein L227DRAFT_650593 [Lentinus tigrinus ALCF2SS1-6]RPD76656.1 hypothetical protein L226DRAFT_569890 [Lentinus tigrinus ALCF2SS1-7]